MTTIATSFLEYSIRYTLGGTPAGYSDLAKRARLQDTLDSETGDLLAVSIERSGVVELAVTLTFSPGVDSGFSPEAHVVPETQTIFLGAGTTLVAYNLEQARRLWTDETEVGFWGWKRHGDTVVMSAELELGAWTLTGEKLWSTQVEPPWSYKVLDGRLRLDVMGRGSEFDLRSGRVG